MPMQNRPDVITDPEVLAKAQVNLEKLLAKAELRINITESSLLKVLDSGRFKNTYETGTTGGDGAGYARKRAERDVLGVYPETPC